MQDELKPCPWCSCKTPYAASPSLGQSYWRVVCDDCGAEGPPWGKDMIAPDCDAACITAWNTRADDAELTRLRAENKALRGALELAMPVGVCLTNRNIPDSTTVPLEISMGDLRIIRAALAGGRDAG